MARAGEAPSLPRSGLWWWRQQRRRQARADGSTAAGRQFGRLAWQDLQTLTAREASARAVAIRSQTKGDRSSVFIVLVRVLDLVLLVVVVIVCMMCVRACACVWTYVGVRLSIGLSVHWSVCLLVCLSICLSASVGLCVLCVRACACACAFLSPAFQNHFMREDNIFAAFRLLDLAV